MFLKTPEPKGLDLVLFHRILKPNVTKLYQQIKADFSTKTVLSPSVTLATNFSTTILATAT